MQVNTGIAVLCTLRMGGDHDEGYIAKTDANGVVTQQYYTYIAYNVAFGDIEFNSIAFIRYGQLWKNGNTPGTIVSLFYGTSFNDDLIVAVGRYRLYDAAHPDDYDAFILLINANTGAILDSRTWGNPDVAKPDGFNSVKFKPLLKRYSGEDGDPTHPCPDHSIIVGGYYAVSSTNTDMFAVTYKIHNGPGLTEYDNQTYGSNKEDFATSVDLMGEYNPTGPGIWKYGMCGGTWNNNATELDGIIVVMNDVLTRLADYQADIGGTGDDCYNSVKFIGGTINYWCQGFVVAGYRTNNVNGQSLKARTLTRFNHNLVRVIYREYSHSTSMVVDEESEGLDVVYVASGFPQTDFDVCGTGPRPTGAQLYTPYAPSDPSTINWLTYSPNKYFDFVLVGWQIAIGSVLKRPIVTRADKELNMYLNPTPPGTFSQIYNQGGFNTHSAIFKSVAKVDETGAVRCLGDIDMPYPSISCNGNEFNYHYEPTIPFYVGTNGFSATLTTLDNSSTCSNSLTTMKTNRCTHKSTNESECGIYPRRDTQHIGIKHYPDPQKQVRDHCEESCTE